MWLSWSLVVSGQCRRVATNTSPYIHRRPRIAQQAFCGTPFEFNKRLALTIKYERTLYHDADPNKSWIIENLSFCFQIALPGSVTMFNPKRRPCIVNRQIKLQRTSNRISKTG